MPRRGVNDFGALEEDGPVTWDTPVSPRLGFRWYGEPVISLQRATRRRTHVRPTKNKRSHRGRMPRGKPERRPMEQGSRRTAK